MKRKRISILFAAALVAGLLCAPALAEDEPETGVFIAGVQLEVGETYTNADFWPLKSFESSETPPPSPSFSLAEEQSSTQGSTLSPPPSPAASEPVVDASAVYGDMTRGADSSDWNATLEGDAASGYTLTIKDLSVMGTNTNKGAAIYSEHDLTIVLQGVNNAIGADYNATVGIGVDGQLVIEGNGTLTVTAGNADYLYYSYGISATDSVKITDGATVIATGGSEGNLSAGIWSNKVEITEGATVIATGGNTDWKSYGICTDAQDIAIEASTVVARAGTVDGEFGSNRWALDGTVTLTDAKLAGAVPSGAEDPTPTVENIGHYTSLAIVPDSWTQNALPDDNTYNITDDTYIVSADACVLEIDSDATIDVAEGKTLLAVSLSEGDGATAGIRSKASVTLKGNIIAVGGLPPAFDGTSSGFEAQGETVTIDGSLLAVGAGTYGYGYSSGADTTVKGRLTGVGVSGAQTRGLDLQGDLTVESGGAVVGHAGPVSGDGATTAEGIYAAEKIFVKGSLTGMGADYGSSGVKSVDGGAYFGKTAAVFNVGLAEGCAFYDENGDVPEDLAAEQYLTVGLKKYDVNFHMDGGFELAIRDIPHNSTARERFGEQWPDEKIEEAFADTRDGYAFGGWYTSGDGGATLSDAPYNFDSQVTANVDLYPKWIELHTVTFDNQGHGTAPAFQSVPHGGYATEPDALTAAGYAFGGWFKDAACTGGNKVVFSAYKIEQDVTLYAMWTRASSGDGGGSGTPAKGPCPQDHTCPIAPFEDADPKGWYHDGVHYCIEQGLMIGTGEAEFQPHGATSRAMIVTVLHRLAGEPEPTTTGTFHDVAGGLWYTQAIEWAAANGIVEGTGAGAFEPEADLTREQMATILYRYAEYKGVDVTAAEEDSLLGFGDADAVSEWADPALRWACAVGLYEGDDKGMLRPADGLERCEMATLIYRFCENILK